MTASRGLTPQANTEPRRCLFLPCARSAGSLHAWRSDCLLAILAAQLVLLALAVAMINSCRNSTDSLAEWILVPNVSCAYKQSKMIQSCNYRCGGCGRKGATRRWKLETASGWHCQDLHGARLPEHCDNGVLSKIIQDDFAGGLSKGSFKAFWCSEIQDIRARGDRLAPC